MYFNACSLHKFYSKKTVRKLKLSPILEAINYFLFNCSLPATAKIGKGTFCSHRGMSVVLHRKAVIGRNTIIGTCVTVGGKGKGVEGAPQIGDNCYIATGAKIIGPIVLGDNVTVGANSVVLCDVPDGDTVVGIPAKSINHG